MDEHNMTDKQNIKEEYNAWGRGTSTWITWKHNALPFSNKRLYDMTDYELQIIGERIRKDIIYKNMSALIDTSTSQ